MRHRLRSVQILQCTGIFLLVLQACDKASTAPNMTVTPRPVSKMVTKPQAAGAAAAILSSVFNEFIYQGIFIYKDDCNNTHSFIAEMVVEKDTTGYYFHFGDICYDFQNISHFALFNSGNEYDFPAHGGGGDLFQLIGNTLNYSGSRPYGCTDHAYGDFTGTLVQVVPGAH